MGFPLVSGVMVMDTSPSVSKFTSLANVPESYRHHYNNPSNGQRCPVMQHCKVQSVPIAWDQTTYAEKGLGELWETQARFGYQCGVSLPLHLPEGRHFVLGVVRDQALPQSLMAMTHIVAALHFFAVHVQESAWRLHDGGTASAEIDSRLTARELECVRWTMEGKTAWEVGRILNIAENTAVRHLYNATRKLGCVSKHHAVIQALRQRLIW